MPRKNHVSVIGILKYIISFKPYRDPIALLPFYRTGNGGSEKFTRLVKHSWDLKYIYEYLIIYTSLLLERATVSFYFMTVSPINL